jgi:hypothetical protein
LDSIKNELQYLRKMAAWRNAQYRKCDARLLRAMIRAAHGFARAQGKKRLEALRRYVTALNEFSEGVLRELPQDRRRMKAPRQRRPGRNTRASAGVLKLRMTSELIPYVGAVGARQILKSVSVSGEPELPAVESVLGMFLGKAAAAQLVDRMIESARTLKSQK